MLLDVFNDSAFNVNELTDAINRIPFKPSRIGEMGLFETKGVTTTSIIIEEKDRVLSLIPTSARGTPPGLAASERRTARNFVVPHISRDDSVWADEVQGVRAFGSQTELEGVAQVVNDKIQSMRQSHEVTLEHLRLGAIKGIVLDADGVTVIHNLFTEFGCVQEVIVVGGLLEFDFTAATPPVRTSCMQIIRAMETNLGGTPYDHIHCFCDATFFDGLTTEAGVLAAYDTYQTNAMLRDVSTMRKGFPYGGIVFEEYAGAVGGTASIPAGAAFFFPVGTPGLFKTYFAPADYIETVNTVGLPLYAKQERMVMDKGVTVETQQNPLCICTRPMTLMRGAFV